MKVLFINSVCGIRSTGRICTDLASELRAQGHECKIAYGQGPVPVEFQANSIRIGNDRDLYLHVLRTRVLDEHGLASSRATLEFLKWAEEYNPDLVWLHNIHGYYINYELLFDWIKSRPRMQVNWTLHDCWAFTGHCSYFTIAKCEQWKSHCSYCPQTRRYPASLLKDNCKDNFDRKRAAFCGVKGEGGNPRLTLITPSQWLADLAKQSFLTEYPVEVRYNSIDTTIFKPTPSDFRKRHGLEGKKVILGVASVWDERKGLGDFIKLAGMLDDSYAIVLVGLNKKQIKEITTKILAIPRTNSPKELAEIYTTADIFVNPSREETFGMTTIEAQACGTHAIVYKGTACEEVVEQFGGKAVEADYRSIVKEITGGGGIYFN